MRRSPARNQAEQQPQDDAEAPATQSTAATKDNVEALLRRLETSTQVSPGEASSGLDQVSSEASEHAESLRATITGLRETQEMLTMATRARGTASEQAEEIIDEAREVADRLKGEAKKHAESARQEASDWAAEQRRTIDAVISELVESATRDAEEIRADALRTSLAEAEKTAGKYVALAAASGARDAEAIRARARDLLTRSSALVSDADVSLQDLAATMSDFVDTMKRQTETMQQLLEEAARPSEEDDRPDDGKVTDLPVVAAAANDPIKESTKEPAKEPAQEDSADQKPVDEPADAEAASGAVSSGRPLGSLFLPPDRS